MILYDFHPADSEERMFHREMTVSAPDWMEALAKVIDTLDGDYPVFQKISVELNNKGQWLISVQGMFATTDEVYSYTPNTEDTEEWH